jgi:O-antigen ligase
MKRNKIAEIVIILTFAVILEFIFVSMGSIYGMIGVAAIAILLSLYNIGLCFYDFGLILMPFMFYLNIGGAVNTSVADFIIVIWLMEVMRRNRNGIVQIQSKAIIKTKIYMKNYAILFMGIMVCSTVNLIRWKNALLLQVIVSIFKILVCLFYSLFTLDYLYRYRRNRFLCVMAYSTIFFDLLMIGGVVAYTRGIDLGLTFAGTFRATGTFEDPNLAAAYLFLMVSFAIVYFSERKNYLLLIVSALLTFVSVFLTSSKGALLAVSVGLVFILIVNLVHGNIGMVLKLLLSYMIIAAILFYLYNHSSFVQQVCEPIFNRFDEFTSDVQGDQSLEHREFLWKTAFELGMREPILGIGVEQFRPAATQYTGQTVWNIVHNTYLTFFCELGIVGVLAFFRLWIKNGWNHFMIMRRNSNSVFYLLSMICVSISMWSISLGNFRTLWVFMTFVLYEYNREIYCDE